MLPMDATTPQVRRVRPKSIEVYWTPRLLGDELPLDQVRRDRAGADAGALPAVTASVDALDPGHGHEPGDPFAVPGMAAVMDLGC
jgi:hypothetical protein